MGKTKMNRELHCLYEQLFYAVRRYFRYEAEPAKQCICEDMMHDTMDRIIDLQERAPDNDEQHSNLVI